MNISIGQIYWIKGKSDFLHPHIVIQINQDSILAVKISTNKKLLQIPGNILLDLNEGNLEKESIVDVSDLNEFKIEELGELIGKIEEKRIAEINNAIRFIKNTYFK